ncbi:hypothetical protein D3C79_1095380 [compost metagenome]
MEVELDATNWTVTVLSDDKVSNIFAFCLGVVVCFAVDEHNDIGILLDRSRFTKVGKLWNLRTTVFNRTR